MNLPLRQRPLPKRPWAPPNHDAAKLYPDRYFRELRCRNNDMLAFDGEKAAKKFMDAMLASNISKIWQCEYCGRWHLETYPTDSGGMTSGKAVRLYYWRLGRKEKFEYGTPDANPPCEMFLRRNRLI